RRPSLSSSGDAKYFWICAVASLGRRLPTGTPPTVTPSGSTRGTGFGGGLGVVVVVGVVVVGNVVVAVVVPGVAAGTVDVVAVVAFVVVGASPIAGRSPPATAYAARTPDAAQANNTQRLRARFTVMSTRCGSSAERQ